MSKPASEQLREIEALIKSSTVDPRDDIKRERARATFPSSDLSEFLYGGKAAVARRRELTNELTSDPVFRRDDIIFLPRTEAYRRAMKIALALPKLREKVKANMMEDHFLRTSVELPLPSNLHESMFFDMISNQGDEEQRAYWLPKLSSYEVVGTYAQTEIGHGTFIRGLETFAIFDKDTQEFVIHTPTDSGIKWWPGGLGKTSTHCVLMARLFIDSKDLGPHPFVIQLRAKETHLPLPGVEVGDIGPKLGYATIDNGYLRLTHYRVPRKSMLMRHAKVTPQGEYIRPPVERVNYATMIFIRAFIVIDAGMFLGKAVTIATRYSAVRRQGEVTNNKETQVIDFLTQQQLLFPPLATSFAMTFTGNFMQKLYNDFLISKDKGDFSALPEVHASSAGLKALTSYMACDFMEQCRKACGGHGFSQYSGIPQLLADYLPNATYEGDNIVLLLQTARYLVKQVLDAVKTKGKSLVGNTRYLANTNIEKERWEGRELNDVLDGAKQIAAFQHRAARLVGQATKHVAERMQNGDDFKTAFDSHTVDLVNASKAHCMYILVLNFVNAVDALPKDASFHGPLKALSDLFSLYLMEQNLGDFLEDNYVSSRQASFIRTASRKLLGVIRPNAVALVDALDYSDYSLNSSLGRYDGDVYRDMYRRAQLEPLNAKPEGPAWDILGPVINAKSSKL